MAKREITKTTLIEMMNNLDQRTKAWTPAKIDEVITDAFAELGTVAFPFTSEVTVDLAPYYAANEEAFSVVITEDVIDVYEMYVVEPVEVSTIDPFGERYEYSEDIIYRDPQRTDVVQIDLRNTSGMVTYSHAVIRYFYSPTADFVSMFISNEVYLPLRYAVASVTYDALNDVERSGQKRAAMMRTAAAIVQRYPEDFGRHRRPSMFPSGV